MSSNKRVVNAFLQAMKSESSSSLPQKLLHHTPRSIYLMSRCISTGPLPFHQTFLSLLKFCLQVLFCSRAGTPSELHLTLHVRIVTTLNAMDKNVLHIKVATRNTSHCVVTNILSKSQNQQYPVIESSPEMT
jgi:hypothetical protein